MDMVSEQSFQKALDKIRELSKQKSALLEALQEYVNVPVMADPGHEQELIDAINKATEALRKAKEE